jgi:transcriptional regulator with XRE-family HTH domain
MWTKYTKKWRIYTDSFIGGFFMDNKRLKELRLYIQSQLGEELTQARCADELEVSKSAWNAYEQGTREVPDEIFRGLCERYGVYYDSLLLKSTDPFRMIEEVSASVRLSGSFMLLTGIDGQLVAVNRSAIAAVSHDFENKCSKVLLTMGKDLYVTEGSGEIFTALGVRE